MMFILHPVLLQVLLTGRQAQSLQVLMEALHIIDHQAQSRQVLRRALHIDRQVQQFLIHLLVFQQVQQPVLRKVLIIDLQILYLPALYQLTLCRCLKIRQALLF